MTSRDIRARLDRLTKVLGEQPQKVPVCRFHGTACRMGVNWPLPFPQERDVPLLDYIRELEQASGEELEPHPRDVWRTDTHEVVPQAELDEEERQLQELLVSLQARNDQIEAELRDERDGLSSEGEWHV